MYKRQVSTPSKAWERARAVNPEPSVSEQMQDELEPIGARQTVSTETVPVEDFARDGHTYADTYSNPETITTTTLGSGKDTITLDVPEDAKGTDEFLKEVDTVDDVDGDQEAIDTFTDEGGSVGYDANGSPTSDFAVPNLPAGDEPTPSPFTVGSKPVISDSNNPAVIKAEVGKTKPLNVRIVPEEEIADFEARAAASQIEYDESDDLEAAKKVEEEFEEVVVPTESELKGMTKSKIRAEALRLGFNTVSTKDSKAEMIAQFSLATEEFISDLQDSGEFISASESGEGEGNETDSGDDVRDGGYFN